MEKQRKVKVSDIYWVCYDCGSKYGQRNQQTVSTYHNGKCDICLKQTTVTQPRDFGYIAGTYLYLD